MHLHKGWVCIKDVSESVHYMRTYDRVYGEVELRGDLFY